MEWKKADAHEWAGDSFNRDSTVCSYTSLNGSNIASTDGLVTISANGDLSVFKGYYNDGVAGCKGPRGSVGSIEIRDDFDSLSNNVAQLTASLQELKDAFEGMKKETMPRASKLRRALKTLNYKYEVMVD